MTSSNRAKQAAFRKRQEARGLVRVCEWLPLTEVSKFKELAAELREKLEVTANPDPVSGNRDRKVTANPGSVSANRDRSPYPLEVRRMAAAMKSAGAQNKEIRAAIMRRVGRAPDGKNIAKVVAGWVDNLTTGDT